jgi:hypothetical protein
MKTGTQQIKYKITDALKKYKAVLNGIKHGPFADELTAEIFELIGGDMNADWNMRHAFPVELEPFVRKIERGLGINLMRDEKSIEVYEWLQEQDREGHTIARWIEWAKDDERVKFINQYRQPGLIKTHYKFAFDGEGKYNPQGLEIGF